MSCSCKSKPTEDVNAFTETEKKKSEKEKMKHNYKKCSFRLEGNSDSFSKVFLHGKTLRNQVKIKNV